MGSYDHGLQSGIFAYVQGEPGIQRVELVRKLIREYLILDIDRILNGLFKHEVILERAVGLYFWENAPVKRTARRTTVSSRKTARPVAEQLLKEQEDSNGNT